MGSNIVNFHSDLGKWSNLNSISYLSHGFVQPPTRNIYSPKQWPWCHRYSLNNMASCELCSFHRGISCKCILHSWSYLYHPKAGDRKRSCIFLFPRSHVPIPQLGYVIGFLEGSLRRFGPPRFCKNLHWWESSTFLRWTSPKLSKGWSRGLRADGKWFFFHDWKRRQEWWDPLNLIWTNGSPIIILVLDIFAHLVRDECFTSNHLIRWLLLWHNDLVKEPGMLPFLNACMISLNLRPSRYVP